MPDDKGRRSPPTERPADPSRLRAARQSGSAEGQGEGEGEGVSRMRLGDFDLLREIGRGGMGVVYEARQISLNRLVALKVLPPGLGLTDQAVQRFEREAQAAAKLHHTNIVPVHAIGEQDGCHFYAMELVDGQPLSEVLDDLGNAEANPLMELALSRRSDGAPAETTTDATGQKSSAVTSLSDTGSSSRKWFDAVARLIAEVGDALGYAHGRGVIHRDIKPGNLMLSREGRLCITDFGLARVSQEPGMTVSGSLMGTPAYMSPEQVAVGRMKLDHRTDIYSLGAVLYEILTHRRPFPGESREEVLGGILTKDPRPPRRINPRIPVDLETICLKAMEKDADRRYSNAGELADDLRRYLQHGLITARRAGILRRGWKTIRRHPLAAVSALAVVLVAAVGVLAWNAMSGERAADSQRLVSEARLSMLRGEDKEALERVERVLALDADNPDARLIRARVSLHRERWWDAVEQAGEVLRIDGDNWEAHLLVAAAATKGALHSVAVDDHLAAVEGRVPDTGDAFFLRGWFALYDGRFQEALGWLDRALQADPSNALALEARSDTYVELKNLPAALADAERLTIARPRESTSGHSQKSRVYLMLHDIERALTAANRCLELEPEDGRFYAQRAEIQAERGRTDAQIVDLNRAIELTSEPDPYWWRSRAAAHTEKGEYGLAVEDARRAIETNPDSGAYVELFWALWNAGSRDEARGAFETLKARAEGHWVQPEGLAMYHEFASEYYRMVGEMDRSLEEAERVIEIRPDQLQGYLQRGALRRQLEGQAGIQEDCDRMTAIEFDEPAGFYRRGNQMRDFCRRLDQARADYDSAIELAPDWADVFLNRGWLSRNEDRFEEALEDLDRAIELAPSWANPNLIRGRIYARMERHIEALADYERSFALGLDGRNPRWYQSVSLKALGRDEEAVSVLDEFLESNPLDEAAHRDRAVTLFASGRVDEAIATLDRALQIDPSDSLNNVYRGYYAAFGSEPCSEISKHLTAYEEREPGSPRTWSTIAYIHGTALVHNCPETHDPETALDYAQRAADYDPEDDSFQHSLGIALYRVGRFEESRQALRRTPGLDVQHRPVNLFARSMAAWRVGDRPQARRLYDQAVEIMRKTHNHRPDTHLYRDEAAQLLEVGRPRAGG